MPAKRNNISSLTKHYLAARRPFLKESSYAHYVELAEHYIEPYVGKLNFEDLDSNKAGEYVSRLKTCGKTSGKGGLSDKTIRDICSLLKSVYYFAAENGDCPSDIRFPRLTLAKPSRMKSQVLAASHQKQLEAYLTANMSPENLGIILCLYTGMRIGEICALKWSDVDFESCLVNVNRTVLRIRNTEKRGKQPKTVIVTGTPKTETSQRVIPVPKAIGRLLKSEGKQMPGDYYVATCSNHLMEPRRYYEKYKQILRKCGITTDYTFHALRHTYATRCIESGIDPKVVSELLGHSSVTITLNRYVHPTMELKKRCVERLLR
ncbi:MAG: site-specific integrase [Clostridiales bacterium]|nr:site-specific integrase [Clostridiales bacterium]